MISHLKMIKRNIYKNLLPLPVISTSRIVRQEIENFLNIFPSDYFSNRTDICLPLTSL